MHQPLHISPTITRRMDTAGMFQLWLVLFLIFDFALFPMFHFHGIPWKPGYIALLIALPLYITNISPRVWSDTRGIFVAFAVLGLATAVGALAFQWQTGASVGGATLRSLIIYAIAPVAFLAGAQDRRRNHSYVIVVIVASLALNALAAAQVSSTEFLRDFYGINDRLSTGTFANIDRIPGIMTNPNITALMGTLLLLHLVLGIRWGYIRVSPLIFSVATLSVIALAVLMVSRNQILAIGIISVAILIGLNRRYSRYFLWLSLALALVVFLSFGAIQGTQSSVGFNPIETTKNNFSRVAVTDFSSPDSFGRSFIGAGEAITRWEISPLSGTGFEPRGDIAEPRYHNDWLTVLTASGPFGFVALVYLAFRLYRISPLLALPFVFPGMTNVLLFVPQHFILLMLIAGLVAARQMAREPGSLDTPAELTVPANRSNYGQVRRTAAEIGGSND